MYYAKPSLLLLVPAAPKNHLLWHRSNSGNDKFFWTTKTHSASFTHSLVIKTNQTYHIQSGWLIIFSYETATLLKKNGQWHLSPRKLTFFSCLIFCEPYQLSSLPHNDASIPFRLKKLTGHQKDRFSISALLDATRQSEHCQSAQKPTKRSAATLNHQLWFRNIITRERHRACMHFSSVAGASVDELFRTRLTSQVSRLNNGAKVAEMKWIPASSLRRSFYTFLWRVFSFPSWPLIRKLTPRFAHFISIRTSLRSQSI